MTRLLLLTLPLSACATRVIAVPAESLAARSVNDGAVSIRVDHDPYRVRGTTHDAIRRSLDRRSTYEDAQGQTWDGGTTWHFRWRWETAEDGGCQIVRPALTGDITVTVPALVVPRRTDAGAVDRFAAYLDALWQHEVGHVDRAARAARAGVDSRARLPPATTCAEAQAAAKSTGAAAMKALDAEQRAYDRATDHGATQGATFP
jgi:predicted secreted Zn-dependent protease